MKTILISILLLLSVTVNSQIFVIIDPAVRRIGLMYNTDIKEVRTNYYIKAQFGVQKADYFYCKSFKFGTGLLIPVSYDCKFIIGLNYSYFFDVTDSNPLININAVKKVCFDIGFRTADVGRFQFLIVSDVINWETSIGFTFKFKK